MRPQGERQDGDDFVSIYVHFKALYDVYSMYEGEGE